MRGLCWTTLTATRPQVLQTFFLSLMSTGRMRPPLCGCSAQKPDQHKPTPRIEVWASQDWSRQPPSDGTLRGDKTIKLITGCGT
jgi:hypothetical protein